MRKWLLLGTILCSIVMFLNTVAAQGNNSIYYSPSLLNPASTVTQPGFASDLETSLQGSSPLTPTTDHEFYLVTSTGRRFQLPREAPTGIVETEDKDGLRYWYIPSSDPSPEIARILGPDDRVLVPDTTINPYRWIVRISSNEVDCTGFLYDDNTVATAGHCVFLNGAFISNVMVTPGQNGPGDNPGEKPFETCQGIEAGTNSRWTESSDDGFDWGWIKLDCIISDRGWFNLVVGQPQGTIDSFLTGYYFDLSNAQKQYISSAESRDSAPIGLDSSLMFSHAHDTTAITSGSPVYREFEGCGRCVFGIHTGSGATIFDDNTGVRIRGPVLKSLLLAADETPYQICLPVIRRS